MIYSPIISITEIIYSTCCLLVVNLGCIHFCAFRFWSYVDRSSLKLFTQTTSGSDILLCRNATIPQNRSGRLEWWGGLLLIETDIHCIWIKLITFTFNRPLIKDIDAYFKQREFILKKQGYIIFMCLFMDPDHLYYEPDGY